MQLETSLADYKVDHFPVLAEITIFSNCDQVPLHCTRSSGLVRFDCRKHGQFGQHPLPELSRINLARHVFLAEPDPA